MDSPTLDQQVDLAVEYGQQALAKYIPVFAPKPLGTVDVKDDEQRFDWENRDGYLYWAQLLADALPQAMATGGNLGDSVIAVLKFDKKMQEKS